MQDKDAADASKALAVESRVAQLYHNADNAADKTRRDQIAQLAEQMLTLHQRHSAARTPQEKTTLERQIAAADTQLDTLIYALYGLTDAEIKIIEAST